MEGRGGGREGEKWVRRLKGGRENGEVGRESGREGKISRKREEGYVTSCDMIKGVCLCQCVQNRFYVYLFD